VKDGEKQEEVKDRTSTVISQPPTLLEVINPKERLYEKR
jgi:hypothetical protein